MIVRLGLSTMTSSHLLPFSCCCCCRPHPSTDNGRGVQHPSQRTQADGIPHLPGIRARLLTGAPFHSTSRFPTSTGAVHKSVTFSCVFILMRAWRYCYELCECVNGASPVGFVLYLFVTKITHPNDWSECG